MTKIYRSILVFLTLAILPSSLSAARYGGGVMSTCTCSFLGKYVWRFPGPKDATQALRIFDSVRRQTPSTTFTYYSKPICEAMADTDCTLFCNETLGSLINDALLDNPERRMFEAMRASYTRTPCLGGEQLSPGPVSFPVPSWLPGNKPIRGERTSMLPRLSPEQSMVLQKALAGVAIGGAALVATLKTIGTLALGAAQAELGLFFVVPTTIPTMPMKGVKKPVTKRPSEIACAVVGDRHVSCEIPGGDGSTVHIAFATDDLEHETPAIWIKPRA